MRPRMGSLLALAAISALAAPGGTPPGVGGMGGGPMSPEDRARRDAEKQSRREWKMARAAEKRRRKAERRSRRGAPADD